MKAYAFLELHLGPSQFAALFESSVNLDLSAGKCAGWRKTLFAFLVVSQVSLLLGRSYSCKDFTSRQQASFRKGVAS